MAESGIRARLRSVCRKAWEFESPRVHNLTIVIHYSIIVKGKFALLNFVSINLNLNLNLSCDCEFNMNMINTSQGPKTPDEALALFKKAQLPKGSLLGIFDQLIGYPQGKEAWEYVLANPNLYDEKLQRLAKEKSTGRPIGAKTVNDEEGLYSILRACGLRARVLITVKKECAARLRVLTSFTGLEIDDSYRGGIMAVAMSCEWQFVPRTFMATLSLASNEEFSAAARALFGVVEKIEIVSTLVERARVYRAPSPLSDEVKATLTANPDLFYDRSLFLKVCEELAFMNQVKRVGDLSDKATMEDVMKLFLTNSSRAEFLELYVERFKAALA